MPSARTILLTAFEPSGDALGAALITGLRRLRPDLKIVAMGGPAMQGAGAELIQTSSENAAMLLGAIAHAREHRRRVARLRQWLGEHAIDALVPIDSPAANWSICQAVRQTQPQARIVHLVAPQLWAWAPWRIGKLRRLTDHVLCLLPFEPQWFSSRGVSASFVGHPLFDDPPQPQRQEIVVDGQSIGGSLRLALLPGSRPGEITNNFPTMLAVQRELRRRHPALQTLVAAREARAAELTRSIGGNLAASNIIVATGQTPAVLRWADVVLVVSGTATLQVAAVPRAMVALFNANRLAWWMLGRWLIQTRTFTLPNLIAQAQGQGAVIREFVPHFGDPAPLIEALDVLLRDPAARTRQVQALQSITQVFTPVRFADTAPQAMLEAAHL